MRVSPTRKTIVGRRQRSMKNGITAIAEARRVEPPKIFVLVGFDAVMRSGIYMGNEGRYARAHLRNKRGYVYLCWREGERVKNYYLGKAPRKCPTDPPRAAAPRSRRRQVAGAGAGGKA